MMKILIGVGVLGALVIGYFLLAPAAPPTTPTAEAPAVETAPAPAATAPDPVVPDETAPVTPNEEALLEEMAADVREGLPEAISETLTLNDAVFLPRMRIMEFSYVTSAADPRAAVDDMRIQIESRAETICREGQDMFEMAVTLRQSFEDRNGNVFQRMYILPEDCLQF